MFRREIWLVNWDHVSVSPVHRASWQTSGEGCSVWLCRCLLWSRLRCGSESSSGCFPAETQRTEVTTRTRENQTCHLVSSKLVLQRLHDFINLFTATSLTKHSAASSMMPSWNLCSSWNVLASALRRASDGRTFSLLYWNWAKMLWRTRRHRQMARLEAGGWSGISLKYQSNWFSPSERRKCTSPPYTYESSADGNYAGRYRGATEPEKE